MPRGNDIAAEAKCIILIIKIGKKQTRFVLAIVRAMSASTWRNSERSSHRLPMGFARRM